MDAGSKDFITMMKEKVAGRNHDGILNMDQVPIPHSCDANKMLDVKGAERIHTRASMTDNKCITLTATVTAASGKMLPTFLIFKSKANGLIAMHKFSTYPTLGIYLCQDKAWMDEVTMPELIDVVLKPWKDA
jgi:hypothetical protein